jgi:hypothetical protein
VRKGAGGAVGLVALPALFLHTQFPSSSENPVPGRDNGGAADTAKSQKGSDSTKPDEPVEGPWIATQAYFQTPGGTRKLDPTLLTQLWPPTATRTPARWEASSGWRIRRTRECGALSPQCQARSIHA